MKTAKTEMEMPKKIKAGSARIKRVDFKNGEDPDRNDIIPETEAEQEEKQEKEPEISYPEPKPKEEGQLTIDVYQTDKNIIIKSTIAGVKSESLDIEITNDMVTVKGIRPKDEEVDQEDYFYQECYWGPFSRTIILPQDILADQAQASMKNGILTITLPKAHAAITRKLKVKTSI